MKQEGGSIIDGEREDFLFTYDEGEKQQNEINRETAKLVYSPEFIPLKPEFLDIFSKTEAILLSFISFYKKNGTGRMYFTNTQLAGIVRCSEDSISAAIGKFIKMGYITVNRKIKAGGGQIRFINTYIEKPVLGKSVVETTEKQGTNKNKINNNIYINKNVPKVKNVHHFSKEKNDDTNNFDFNSTDTSIDNEIVNEQEVDIISKDIIDENNKRKIKQKESGGDSKNYDKMNNDLIDKLMFYFGFNYDDVKKSMSGYFPNPKDIRNACVDIHNFSNKVKKEYGISLDIEYTYDIINLFRYNFNLDRRNDMLQYIEDHGDDINNIDDLLRETERFNIM